MATYIAAPAASVNANQNAAQPITGALVTLIPVITYPVIPAPFFGSVAGGGGSSQGGYAT